jgi:hypothetical protein
MSAIIKREIGPLAIDAREQQSGVRIRIFGANGLPDIDLVLDGCGVHDTCEGEQFHVEETELPAEVDDDGRSRS